MEPPAGSFHNQRPPLRHGRLRPAICCADARPGHPAVVMAGPDRPSLPPGHHFCPFLLAWRSFSSVKPPFSALFVGSAVVFVRRAVIFGHFCWLDGHFLPSSRHFRPFLSAQRSFLSAGPSFLAIFAGLTVVMAGSDRPSLPPVHHFRPFLSVWWQMADQVGHDAGGVVCLWGMQA